jgi:hypothetical protein
MPLLRQQESEKTSFRAVFRVRSSEKQIARTWRHRMLRFFAGSWKLCGTGELLRKSLMDIMLDLFPFCIQTEAKRTYTKLLNRYFKADGDKSVMEEQIEGLTFFLKHADFGYLRSRYPELDGIINTRIILSIPENRHEMQIVCQEKRIEPKFRVEDGRLIFCRRIPCGIWKWRFGQISGKSLKIRMDTEADIVRNWQSARFISRCLIIRK